MKTAEEWITELQNKDADYVSVDDVQQIQLDAMKEGAARSAQMVKNQDIHSDFALGHATGGEQMAGKILRESSNWTEKDL